MLQGNLSNQQRVRLHDPVHEKLDEQLKARETEYSSFSSQSNPLTLSPFHVRSDLHFPTGGNIWVGTYNLNGKPPGSESLLPWLFPDPSKLDFLQAKRGRAYSMSLFSLRARYYGNRIPRSRSAQRGTDRKFSEICPRNPCSLLLQIATDPEKK